MDVLVVLWAATFVLAVSKRFAHLYCVMTYCQWICFHGKSQKCLHFSICACHPCAGAILIFSVSFQV